METSSKVSGATVGIIGALIAAGCSNDDSRDPSPTATAQAETQSAESPPPTEPTIEDAEDRSETTIEPDVEVQSDPTEEVPHEVSGVFGPPDWVHTAEATTLRLTPEAIYLASGDTVSALSAEGEILWDTSMSGDLEELWLPGSDAYPALRTMENNSVLAYIELGQVPEEGLSEATDVVRVSLIDTADGAIIDTVDVDIDRWGYAPELSDHAVVLFYPTESAIVRADGSTEVVPDAHIVMVGETQLHAGVTGLDGPDWTGADLVDGIVEPRLIASDGRDLLIVEITEGNDLDRAVVRASTGESLGRPGCALGAEPRFAASPNGEHTVVGAARISNGELECIGGGEGERDVTLTAVDDDGNAYGYADSSTGTGAEFLTATAAGDVELSPYPETLPALVMDSGLVIHASRADGLWHFSAHAGLGDN